MSVTDPQPPPKPSTGDIQMLVMIDMAERRLHGIEKYGTPVQPHNGRDALIDAYQEALDLCVYLRQAIEERKIAPFTEEFKRRGEEIVKLKEQLCVSKS